MVNEKPTRICLKMKQVIMETPVEYDGQITTRIPNVEKARFYRRAKKEGIKPSELQRQIFFVLWIIGFLIIIEFLVVTTLRPKSARWFGRDLHLLINVTSQASS